MTQGFQFFSGDDDYLLTQRAKAVWSDWIEETKADEYSIEIIDGRANNVSDVDGIISQTVGSLQAMSLFGGAKLVWIRNANFFADSVTGRAQGTLDRLDRLKSSIETLDGQSARLLISATPVDRRRAGYKWFYKQGNGQHLAFDGKNLGPLYALIEKMASEAQVEFSGNAREILIAKVSGNARVVENETAKIATMVGPGGTITEDHIHEHVPVFGDTDFFEAAEAFYTLDLSKTLLALDRHFFTFSDARGLISNLQGRNRLLIQIRTLIDAKAIRLSSGPRGGVDKSSWESAQRHYGDIFGSDNSKSGFNIFSQNAWYVGMLARTAERLKLKKLVDFQLEFSKAFEQILNRPTEQHTVMRETAIRCLG
ncbi:MAG: DNA polymerase III subunit delta [Verrucomicrobiota bacterium]